MGSEDIRTGKVVRREMVVLLRFPMGQLRAVEHHPAATRGGETPSIGRPGSARGRPNDCAAGRTASTPGPKWFPSTPKMKPLLIVGLGNPLMGDDGVGAVSRAGLGSCDDGRGDARSEERR